MNIRVEGNLAVSYEAQKAWGGLAWGWEGYAKKQGSLAS